MRLPTLACLAALAALVGATETKAAGALAVGQCGAFGYAFGDASIASAQKRAMHECRGTGCRVVATMHHTCAALAIDGANVCGPHGWATANTLGRAQNAASKNCYQFGGRNCVIRAWACDAKG